MSWVQEQGLSREIDQQRPIRSHNVKCGKTPWLAVERLFSSVERLFSGVVGPWSGVVGPERLFEVSIWEKL